VYVAGSWALGMISPWVEWQNHLALLVAMAAVSAWDKLGNTDDEAKQQNMSTGEFL
jgi:hypothetical protein